MVQRLRWQLRAARPDGIDAALAADEAALTLLRAGLQAAAATRPRQRRRPQTDLAHLDMIAAVREVIASSLGAPLTLAAIAARVHTSPFHLARVFRAFTGTSIHRHRAQLRLRTALDRLGDGERDLSRLALELGFASHSHLTDSFRREFGAPPSRYRQWQPRRPSTPTLPGIGDQ
jgi:AraC family transcriptional regulator